MLIFLKADLVLFSMTKSASTALEAAALPHASIALRDPPGTRHMSLREYRAKWGNLLNRRFAFDGEGMAVLRDPLDRLGSWYRYRGRGWLDDSQSSTRDMSFDAFVNAVLDGELPQVKGIGRLDRFVRERHSDAIGITHLFSYPALDEAVGFLEARIGQTLRPLPHLNVSPVRALSLSPETEARFRRERAGECALYDRVAETGYLYSPPVEPEPAQDRAGSS